MEKISKATICSAPHDVVSSSFFAILLFTCLFCPCCSFFFLFLYSQLDNSIFALSHVQWNVAPTGQTDLAASFSYFFNFYFFDSLEGGVAWQLFNFDVLQCTWPRGDFSELYDISFVCSGRSAMGSDASESRVPTLLSTCVCVCMCSVKEVCLCLVWLHLATRKRPTGGRKMLLDGSKYIAIWWKTRDKITVTIPAGWSDLKFRRMSLYWLR